MEGMARRGYWMQEEGSKIEREEGRDRAYLLRVSVGGRKRRRKRKTRKKRKKRKTGLPTGTENSLPISLSLSLSLSLSPSPSSFFTYLHSWRQIFFRGG
jgi:hypothetical protein